MKRCVVYYSLPPTFRKEPSVYFLVEQNEYVYINMDADDDAHFCQTLTR